MKGWYTRIITDKSPEIRWLTVSEFWISIYSNKSEKIPMYLIQTSNLTIEEAPESCGLAHSFKLVIKHICTKNNIIISTPNQFDIEEIKEAITTEQTNWYKKIDLIQPDIPKTFVTDTFGNFAYKKNDRVNITINETNLTIEREGQEKQEINYNETFDAYPTLEKETDVKWISIQSNMGSFILHFNEISEMKSFILLCLHAFYISQIGEK